MKKTVLVLIVDREKEKILLAYKKRGFGSGKLNGAGGKIESGETPVEAVVRETEEEFGMQLKKTDLIDVGECFFYFENRPEWNIHNKMFFAYRWSGEPAETEEMGKPEWFLFDTIPYEKMWADDALWLPNVLAGKHIRAKFYFDKKGEKILRHSIK